MRRSKREALAQGADHRGKAVERRFVGVFGAPAIERVGAGVAVHVVSRREAGGDETLLCAVVPGRRRGVGSFDVELVGQ